MSDLRWSIQPTYDSRDSGDRYWVTTSINDEVIEWRKRMPDPFVRHTVRMGWRDILRCLLRRRLEVEVLVGADPQVVDDVMELDSNTLTPNSTRRMEWDMAIRDALRKHPSDDTEGEGHTAKIMGALLGQALKADGISQAEFARRVGTSEKHLSQVITGRATAHPDTLDTWVSALGRRFTPVLRWVAPQYDDTEGEGEPTAEEIDRCHEATEFDHQCRVCRPAADAEGGA